MIECLLFNPTKFKIPQASRGEYCGQFISELETLYKKLSMPEPIKKIVVFNSKQISESYLRRLSELKSKFPFIEIEFQRTSDYKSYLVNTGLNLRIKKKRSNKNTLCKKEQELLNFLSKNKNKVLSKEVILSAVWGYNELIFTHTLETHIAKLRYKLNNNKIKTIYGRGYLYEE